jgi:mono/diheme cytochrome c family protein
VLAALWALGCRQPEQPEFRLNLEGRDPAEISRTQLDAVRENLEKLFGTPDAPSIPEETGLNVELLEMAAGPIARFEDERGRPVRQSGLYRQHCAGCHGISGAGAGPLASVLDPYPRDFRNGLFKYTSTVSGTKPRREDLERTLFRGIPATAMPSFARLEPREVAALIEYLKYLSIRGETELYVFQLIVDEEELLPLDPIAKESIMEDGVLWAGESWQWPEKEPDEYVVSPPPRPRVDTPERAAGSVALGHELYASKDAQCVQCHGPEGAGDGEKTDLYDDWNERKRRAPARLFTLPIQRLPARDFREGAFRGGDRPEDLYLRIHIGINGTPMPGVGPMPGIDGALTPEEIWHVVDYVRSLAPGARSGDRRLKIDD